MSARPLILVGAGGHCKSVIELALRCGRHILGAFDIAEKVGQYVGVVKIIGTDDDIAKYVDEAEFVITVGHVRDCSARAAIAQKLRDAGASLATLISPRASVSDFAKVCEGSVVMAGACVNYGAFVGANCIINTGAIVEHDAFVNHLSHISTGAIVNGDCKIGARTFVGSGAVLVNGISIAEDTLVGAGAVVTQTITERGTYVGVPARAIIDNLWNAPTEPRR